MITEIVARRGSEGWTYIELRPSSGAAIRPLSHFTESAVYQFHRVDMRATLPSIFERFHKSCVQRKIRRAERERVICERGRSERLLHQFYSLLMPTCRRKRLPPQPIQWFRNLIRSLDDRITIHVARRDSRPVASIITVQHRRSLVYKYACSDAKFHPLGGIQLLLWEAIQDAKQHGVDELDLGRSDVDHVGLVDFKSRWGAHSFISSYLRSSSSPNPGALLAKARRVRVAGYVFARMPEILLVNIGRLLYRHAG
jgi:lipid II:glycine glycyltransferase (peptidoglycan interpeptide bridge formation enzyme)